MIYITAELAYTIAAKKKDEQSDIELHYITRTIKKKHMRENLLTQFNALLVVLNG